MFNIIIIRKTQNKTLWISLYDRKKWLMPKIQSITNAVENSGKKSISSLLVGPQTVGVNIGISVNLPKKDKGRSSTSSQDGRNILEPQRVEQA